MNKFAHNTIALLLLCFIWPSFSNPQLEVQESRLKAAFVGQFTQFIKWPTPTPVIEIAYFGDDQAYWQSLKEMTANSNQVGPFELRRFHQIKDIANNQPHILVLDKSKNEFLSRISNAIGKAPLLIVTEYMEDNKLIGINFIKTENQTLSFQLNRYNLLYQGLNIDKDIVLLGGSEIDVANMVKEMSFKLSESSTLIEKLNQHINSQKSSIAQQQQAIDKKQKIIDAKQREINSKNREFSNLTKTVQQAEAAHQAALERLQHELNQAQITLDLNNKQLIAKQKEVQQAQAEIDKIAEDKQQLNQQMTHNQQRIASQKQTLLSLENQLGDTERALVNKEQQIQNTTYILIISLFALLAFVILAISLWYFNKKKNTLNLILEAHNVELEQVNQQLIATQKQLVESEKMASLGGVVTGVAHEVNTPLGSAITAISHLSSVTTDLMADFKEKKLSTNKFERVLNEQIEATNIVFKNLCRAAELVKSFKQVSADQVSEIAREFELVEYIQEVITSLAHQLKQNQVKVTVNSEKASVINTYPGVLSQVISNLIINSITHAFKDRDKSEITINISVNQSLVTLDYHDNGCGIPSEKHEQIFEPFYTTNRHSGSTGLGLSICYNLVTQKLDGNIKVKPCNEGAHFMIQFPTQLQTDRSS